MSSSRMHSLHTNQKMEFIKKNEEKERHDFKFLNLLMQIVHVCFLYGVLRRTQMKKFAEQR